MNIRLFQLLWLLLLTACASSPGFDNKIYKSGITPEQVISDMGTYRGAEVLWGGLLVSSTNLEQSTQLEILAYPLDSKQKPNTSRAPQGRFILIEDRFLEPVDYSEGRMVTITGKLAQVQSGVVGSAPYNFPVVDAEQIYLWPKNAGKREPRVHFGVGVIFGN